MFVRTIVHFKYFSYQNVFVMMHNTSVFPLKKYLFMINNPTMFVCEDSPTNVLSHWTVGLLCVGWITPPWFRIKNVCLWWIDSPVFSKLKKIWYICCVFQKRLDMNIDPYSMFIALKSFTLTQKVTTVFGQHNAYSSVWCLWHVWKWVKIRENVAFWN